MQDGFWTIDAETTAALIADAKQAEADFLAALLAQNEEWIRQAEARIEEQPETVSDEEWWGLSRR